MKETAIKNILKKIHKGSFTRIAYVSEPALKAAAKRNGIVIHKYTEKTIRVGVAYDRIERVRKKKLASTDTTKERTPWCHWEVPNMIAKHNTKDSLYLSFANVHKGAHTKTKWFLNGIETSFEDIVASKYILPSYFNSSEDFPDVQIVKFDSIVKLGGVNV